MPFQIALVKPSDTLTNFARIYGCGPEHFAQTLAQIEGVWKATDEDDTLLGILGYRNSPVHGAEIMGGVLDSSEREQVALTLLKALLLVQPKAYAYADETYWPTRALEQAGFKPYRNYTHSSGQLPDLQESVPEGFKIVPLSAVSDLKQRWAAQEGWSDLIGHSTITEETIIPNAGGSDDTLGCLALDESGQAVGVCRVWQSGEEISLTTPAVRPEARGKGLREAMLAWVCGAARERGVTTMVVEVWGDSDEDRANDEKLGLTTNVVTPIYTTPRQSLTPTPFLNPQ